MNQPSSKTIRYAVAGVCVLLVLLFLGWFVLREPPVPANDQPVETAAAPPRVHYVAAHIEREDEADRETMTNQIAVSTTTNAAALYREAFALYEVLSKEQRELVSNWRTNADASVEAELCEKIQPICNLLHQAAAVSNCDWGVEQPLTYSTLLPHLGLGRNLTRVVVWSVAHCRTGDSSAAVDDLVAGSRLGQNVSSPTLIGHLVDLAIQNMVIESGAEHASALAGIGDTRLSQLFDDMDFNESLQRAFRQEADMVDKLADRWVPMARDEVVSEMKQIPVEAMEPAKAIADMRQVAELEREWAQAVGLPEAQYNETMAHITAAGKINAFVGLLMPQFDVVVDKTQRTTINCTMVVAGLAVAREGTDVLPLFTDPATGKPFVYQSTADGFELQSGYQFNGQPVKLRFK